MKRESQLLAALRYRLSEHGRLKRQGWWYVPKNRFNDAKRDAVRAGHLWSISLEDWTRLIDRQCEYCGGQLRKTGSGLDRKDCSLGYSLENVVPCCKECNMVKSNVLSYDEMKVAMRAVLVYRRFRDAYGAVFDWCHTEVVKQ